MVLLMPATELLANFDGQRVGQMLINLLSNAVKCSFLNSEVIVSAYDSGQNVKVTVASTGPAIEKTEASQLFTRYYRSKRTSGPKGAGLGLFIVKELAEAHGGTVFVESHESGKTAFGFIIPKNGSKAEAVEGDFTALRDHQSEENAQRIPRHH
jgi:signal transduction histidine kinase